MTLPNPLVGSYCGVEALRRAVTNLQTTQHDAELLEHLNAASREIERLTLRYFYPYLTTAYLRWPQLAPQTTWMLWTPDDLLSVTSLQVAASGNGASPVPITHFYLEPNDLGPPFSRVEVDLSYSDTLQSGPTPQRSIALTGMFGYCNTTAPAGSLAADVTAGATSLAISDASRIDQGDVLLIDSEAIYVDTPRNVMTTLAVQRGVNGTTPASHTNGTAIRVYRAPMDIRRVVRADAIGTFQQDQASWGRTIGAGEMAVEWQGKQAKSMRQTVVDNYARKRTAAI